MQIHLKMLCKWVRDNNGIVQVLFVSSDGKMDTGHEQHALINIKHPTQRFEEGKFYWIDIQPAFPH